MTLIFARGRASRSWTAHIVLVTRFTIPNGWAPPVDALHAPGLTIHARM